MATNEFFPLALSAFARGEIDWEDDDLIVYLLGDGWTYSDLYEFVDDLSDILASVVVTGAAVLDGGVLDMDDLTVTGLDLGETCTQIVVAQNFGTAATDRLILHFGLNNDGIPIDRAGDGAAFSLLVSNDDGRLARL